jgi:hypothetical protein
VYNFGSTDLKSLASDDLAFASTKYFSDAGVKLSTITSKWRLIKHLRCRQLEGTTISDDEWMLGMMNSLLKSNSADEQGHDHE